MEHTSREFKRVHVVQSAYLANGPLSAAVENFTEPGVTLPRVLFLASRQSGIEHIDYFDRRVIGALAKASREFSSRRELLSLTHPIRVRKLADGALRFQVMPVDIPLFHEGVDVIDQVPTLPSAFIGPQRHFLQFKLAAHHVGDVVQTGKAMAKLRDEARHRLYSVRPHELIERVIELPVKPVVTSDQ